MIIVNKGFMKNMLIVFCLFFSNLSFSQEDSLNRYLIIQSSSDILMADTSIIYKHIFVYEHDSLIHELKSIENLHFRKFTYDGSIRFMFPVFNKKHTEISEATISGKKLRNIPSFIGHEALLELTIETFNYKIDIDISKFKNLIKLALYTKNTYQKLNEICKLEHLEELVLQEKSSKTLSSLDCLANLKKIKTLYVSYKLDNIKDLLVFSELKKLYIANKISYKFISNNLPFFKQFEKVSFWNFTGTMAQKSLLKKELKGIWQ